MKTASYLKSAAWAGGFCALGVVVWRIAMPGVDATPPVTVKLPAAPPDDAVAVETPPRLLVGPPGDRPVIERAPIRVPQPHGTIRRNPGRSEDQPRKKNPLPPAG